MPYLERKPRSQYIYMLYQRHVDNNGQPYEEWLKVGGTKKAIRLGNYTTFTERDLQQRGLQPISNDVAQSVLETYEDANKYLVDYVNQHLIDKESSPISDLPTLPIGSTIWRHVITNVNDRIDILQIERHSITEQGVAYVCGPSESLGDGLEYIDQGVIYEHVDLQLGTLNNDTDDDGAEIDNEPIVVQENIYHMSLADYQHLTQYIRRVTIDLWKMLTNIDDSSFKNNQPDVIRFLRYADLTHTLTSDNRCYKILKGGSIYYDIYLGQTDPVSIGDDWYIYDQWLRLGGRENYITIDEFTECPEFSHVKPNPEWKEEQVEKLLQTVIEMDQKEVVRWCLQYENYVNNIYEQIAAINKTKISLAISEVATGTCLILRPTATAYTICQVSTVKSSDSRIEIKGEQIQLDGYKRKIVKLGTLDYQPNQMGMITNDKYKNLRQEILDQQALLINLLQN